jgi:hypothetical protein
MTFTKFSIICAKGIKNYFYQTVYPRYEFKRMVEIWFRDFTTGLDNLLYWFPTIWSDRYWDHSYLFKIIRKKLNNMEKNIRSQGLHVDAITDADNMLICINALDKLIADNYSEEAFIEHDKKWGDLEWEKGKIISFKRKNVITEQDKLQERVESKLCWEKAEEDQKQDLETLFNTMKSESLRWWD